MSSFGEAFACRQRSHHAAGPRTRAAAPGRAVAAGRARGAPLCASRGLFDPPPFQPEKLTVSWAPGTSKQQLDLSRRYTLTHNDITGALQLSVGTDYNHSQISGFYTKLLRDEVTAEWRWDNSGTPSLHIFCHVSGEERWLAPPLLRNYIFRREMPLVLECFLYADQKLLACVPHLARASVFVHFQSSVEDLDSIECWGRLGERQTWQPPPVSILKRLIFGLVGMPIEEPLPGLGFNVPPVTGSSHLSPEVMQAASPTAASVVTAASAVAAAAAAAAVERSGSLPQAVPLVAALVVSGGSEDGPDATTTCSSGSCGSVSELESALAAPASGYAANSMGRNGSTSGMKSSNGVGGSSNGVGGSSNGAGGSSNGVGGSSNGMSGGSSSSSSSSSSSNGKVKVEQDVLAFTSPSPASSDGAAESAHYGGWRPSSGVVPAGVGARQVQQQQQQRRRHRGW